MKIDYAQIKDILHSKVKSFRMEVRLYWSGFALFLIGLFLLPKHSTSHEISLNLSLILFGAGTITFLVPMILRIWKHVAFKLSLLVLNFALAIFAAAYAKNYVAESIKLPVQDYPLTTSFFALISYIPISLTFALVLFVAISILLSIWHLIVAIIGMASHPLDSIAGFIDSFIKVKAIRNEISKAKTRTEKTFFINMARTTGSFAIVFILISLIEGCNDLIFSHDGIPKTIAFFFDYTPANNYPGLLQNQRVIIHNNGLISVATMTRNRRVDIELYRVNQHAIDASCPVLNETSNQTIK